MNRVQARWEQVQALAARYGPSEALTTTRQARGSGAYWKALESAMWALQGGVCATCGQVCYQDREGADAAGLYLAVPSRYWQAPRAGFVEGNVIVCCGTCRNNIKRPLHINDLAIGWDKVMLNWPIVDSAIVDSVHRDIALHILEMKGLNIKA